MINIYIKNLISNIFISNLFHSICVYIYIYIHALLFCNFIYKKIDKKFYLKKKKIFACINYNINFNNN